MVGEPKVVCGAYQKQFQPSFENSAFVEKKAGAKNGLVKEGKVWYLYKNGEIDRESSLAKNSRGWWYVKDGKIDFTYTGVASNEKGLWYVQRGKVNFTYTGNFYCDGCKYKVLKGKIVK